MLKVESATIMGTEYQVTQLPYKQGRQLLLRLYKVLGPTLASAVEQAPVKAKISELGNTEVSVFLPALGAAVRTLAEQLSEEDFDYAVETLANFSELGKGGGKFVPLASEMEFHFAGNYGQFFAWLAFALKVNYRSFLDGRGALGNLVARAASLVASQSQNTSTGTATKSPPAPATPAA